MTDLVHDAKVKGGVSSPSSSFITLEEKPIDKNGVVTFTWSIDKHADTGEFTVVLRVTAEGYEPTYIRYLLGKT